MSKVISLWKAFTHKTCYLFCEVCERNTVHKLTKSGDAYVCGCGNVIDVEYKDNE